MSWWRQLTGGLRVLVRRDAADADLADEVQHFLDEATAAHLAAGLPADAARRAARLDVGNASAVRDEVRASAWEHLLDTTIADVVYAARRLRAHRASAIVRVPTLPRGIGATAAIFSAIKPILAEPLPYPHPERIVTIADFRQARAPIDVTFGTFRELAARTRSFESLAVMKPWLPTLTGQAEPERLEGQRVSAGYLRVLGLAPAIGRDFEPADDREGGPNVVILSYRLWRRLFNGDRSIVGRPIVLDDNAFTVVGVMPPFENVLAPSAEIWAPLQYATSFTPVSREWGHHLRMAGRLRAGISVERARRELDEMARAPRPEFARVPWASLGFGLLARPLRDDVTAAVRPALLAIVGAVVVLLAIACVNVTNLLLARGAQRRGELAMRIALGAGRGRLLRQLLTESVVMAIIGGTCGLVVAQIGVRALVALSPPGLPRIDAIGLDGSVFV